MSAAQHRRRDEQAIANAARVGARQAGCLCVPDIEVVGDGDDVVHAQVAHDDWCPAANSSPQIVVVT